ncbi:flagella basal body P-ring formation protein FlgA [Desulfurobacterium pacificum]|uniref:Flagella basal body P-ring formation protein FlgA n=1 Tax=Desulfurobacterium pacificum TaxID=240166 RepID=A0ABY1NMD3_9BACT|nr:flagellar basal body P-ring formation chaperone FlgA [Desulfurobacterium pacificum]SMP13601.1 flagella basal body P-ring formation protein FlgA [Desulfurobacterium pacificum]
MKCLGLLRRLSLNFLFLFVFFFAVSAFGADVVLKDKAKVSSDFVYLKDIAVIKGSPVERQVLSGIVVSDSPYLCRTKVLNVNDVKNRVIDFLKKNGVNVKVSFKGSPIVEVKRLCAELPADKISQRLKSLIEKEYPGYIFVSASVPHITLPYSNFKTVISIQSLGDYYGRALCQVVVNGSVVKRIWIPFRVERKVSVVVAKRVIPKGKVISGADVVVKGIPQSKARDGIASLSEVVGKVAKRDFRAGEVIKRRDLVPNFIVFKGKPVKVIYDSGGIHIELLGVPMENGALGDIIRVKNISTGKQLICKVIGKNTVTFVSH